MGRDEEHHMPSAATLDESEKRLATPQERQDSMRSELSKIEDAVLRSFDQLDGDSRWMAIARTHIEQGFMAAKRSLYGKRVGDP